MALAMGLQVALARVGTAFALFFALPIAQKFGLVSSPVMLGASALCIGLIAYIVYCVMDKKLDASIEGQEVDGESEEQFKFSDLKAIFCNKGFWLITFLCLIFYSAVFPFLKFHRPYFIRPLVQDIPDPTYDDSIMVVTALP